ncbi:transglycosylase domain-containing protein [Schaalia sp. 19OD2882]|uniref:transglycosylase domain-containing protein n=1 Tax=Schaalia sp. 19OD2882 TaxID=2794089 RepID=UPI0020A6F6B3|nr:transglycosylase domain-containing protein [Schaalia sp. 19OD2882]
MARNGDRRDWDDIIGSPSPSSRPQPPSRAEAARRRAGSGAGGGVPAAPARRSVRGASEPAGASGARSVRAHASAASGRGGPGRKRSWPKRIGLAFVFTFLGVVIAGSAAFLYLYAQAKVPVPDEFALAQTTTVYYADGTTRMGSLSEVNRTIIDGSTLPDHVSKAVVASEDRTFYTNSGVDFKGILRALWTNITQGTRHGASTLTMQYVERYYVGDTFSYMGKIKEAILAIKISREQDKDQILANYLNTIYFGRGAYGIEAAAKAYFGKPAAQLSLSEAAMIAGIIPAPSAWDPAVDPEMAKERWQRVLDIMVEDGWISQKDAAAQTFPTTVDPATLTLMDFSGANGYLLQQVRSELIASGAFTDDQIDTGGLKIISTIDKARQEAAVAAANSMTQVEGWDPNTMHTAITSVNPANGEIVAEFGGVDFQKRQQNAATQDISQAGSTFKLFTLLANAEQGGSIYKTYDGNSPMHLPGDGGTIQNDGGYSWGRIDLVDAMKYSVNTAFVELNQEIGSEATKKAAIAAGIPEDTLGLDDTIGNVLGTAAPHNVDLAAAFATVAAGGQRTTPHIVREVIGPDGSKVFAATTTPTQAFTPEVVSMVMPALEAVTKAGGTAEELADFPFSTGGKTGTSSEQISAQFVGFVPELSTAVSMYQNDAQGNPVPLTNIGGMDQFHGGDWPVDVWMSYMGAIEGSLSVTDFSWYVEVEQERPAPQSDRPQSAPQTQPAPTQPTQPAPAQPAPQPAPTPDPGQSSGPTVPEPSEPEDPSQSANR